MTAKKYLGELRRMAVCVEQKTTELRALYSVSLGSPLSDREGVRGGTEDRMAGLVHRIDELKAEIDQQTVVMLERKHTIIDQIQGLKKESHVKVLYKRYVEFKDLERIARETGYTYDHTRHLHGWALQEFERTYPDEIAAFDEHRRKVNTQSHI